MKLSHFVACLFVAATMAMMISDASAQGGGGQGRGGRGGAGPGGGLGSGLGGGGRAGAGMMGGRMMGDGGPMVGLLLVDKVREELKLDDKQMEAIKKIRSENRPDRPDFDFRTANEEERKAALEKMQAERTKQVKKMREQLEEILIPEQLERLEEISLQVRGVAALADPEVQDELGMSDVQKKKLEDVRNQVQEDTRNKMREMMQQRGDREAMSEAFTKIRKELDEEVLKALTPEQRTKFDKMKGKAFEMPEGQGGFGQRGGMMDGRGGDRPQRGTRPRQQPTGATE